MYFLEILSKLSTSSPAPVRAQAWLGTLHYTRMVSLVAPLHFSGLSELNFALTEEPNNQQTICFYIFLQINF